MNDKGSELHHDDVTHCGVCTPGELFLRSLKYASILLSPLHPLFYHPYSNHVLDDQRRPSIYTRLRMGRADHQRPGLLRERGLLQACQCLPHKHKHKRTLNDGGDDDDDDAHARRQRPRRFPRFERAQRAQRAANAPRRLAARLQRQGLHHLRRPVAARRRGAAVPPRARGRAGGRRERRAERGAVPPGRGCRCGMFGCNYGLIVNTDCCISLGFDRHRNWWAGADTARRRTISTRIYGRRQRTGVVLGQRDLWMRMQQYSVSLSHLCPFSITALLTPNTTDTTSTHPSPQIERDSNNEPTAHSTHTTHTTLADTQHAARVPLPPPTTSFAQPTVDVTEDTETGSPVVTVHPEPGPEPESASAGDVNVNAAVFGAVGSRAPRSRSQSNFNDSVGDDHADMGPPDSLPSLSNPQASGTGTTAPSAPTALEKPISVVPMSGALSAPPPPPKDTTTTSSIPARQDTETRSTSSDAAIPSMGSEDKLGGREPASRRLDDDDENVDETDRSENDTGKQKKGASKLLGKMKEKLKTASHGQKA